MAYKNKTSDSNVNNIIARKVQLIPVGDKEEVSRVYKYLRDGIEAQNKGMNQYMSALYAAVMMEACKDDRSELSKLYSRISSSKLGSAYSEDIVFAKGLPIGAFKQKVENDFQNAIKKGLLHGETSLPSYRDTNPLLIHVDYVRLRETNPHRDCGLYHGYENNDDFLSHLFNPDLEVYIKFADDITFKIIFGNVKKSYELRTVFKNIFNGTYSVRGSSIGFKKTKIMLNLSIQLQELKVDRDEKTSVGVDAGMAIPAYCGLNNNDYVRLAVGFGEDLQRYRTQTQAEIRRKQKGLQFTSGGHGRKKKLQALDRFKEYEKNYVSTYNHGVSKKVVDFAVKNNAKYINLECLKGFDASERALRNWSYYQLQTYIKYKANLNGITVRYVNPCYTSQVCSCCGHWEEDQRVSQDTFICKNPECKNHGVKVNADFNASRNIAKSTLFIDMKNYKATYEEIEKLKKQAREYYNIPETETE